MELAEVVEVLEGSSTRRPGDDGGQHRLQRARAWGIGGEGELWLLQLQLQHLRGEDTRTASEPSSTWRPPAQAHASSTNITERIRPSILQARCVEHTRLSTRGVPTDAEPRAGRLLCYEARDRNAV